MSSKFRKVPRCETSRKETFKVREVREFEYGGSHEILVKKNVSSLESPLGFTLKKSGTTATLPSEPLYGSKLPINPNKLKDITNLANKYYLVSTETSIIHLQQVMQVKNDIE